MITPQLVVDSFRTVRGNTIEIARDIPADKYGFRATPETRSVIEYFRDIIRITEFVVGVALYEEEKVTYEMKSREEWGRVFLRTNGGALETPDQVIAALQASMDDLAARVLAADPAFLNTSVLAPDGNTKVRLWAINTAKEQEMVIRSQLYLIERMLGIVPHTTRRRQEKDQAKAAGKH